MLCRLALVGCLLGTGCFYIDPINQRPSIAINQTSSDVVYRTEEVRLKAVTNDPEGHLVFCQWRAYACVDANDFSTCDQVPFETEELDSFNFYVPATLADQTTKTQSLLVILEAQDDYGAIARPAQNLIIPISNYAPVLSLNEQSKYDHIVNTPINLSAKITDLDDGPAGVTLEWNVYTPLTQPTYDIENVNIVDPMPDKEMQDGRLLTPHGIGDWEVEVIATDPLGVKTMQTVMFKVEPDKPPCLAQWSPIAAPSGSELPLTEATLFQVSVVRDGLDPYPTMTGDALIGTSTFAWSIKQPGASTRTPLGVDGNAVALDPGNYTFGDVIELRVEAFDRNNTPVNCADGQDTCSLINDPTCIQRQTWHVEVQ